MSQTQIFHGAAAKTTDTTYDFAIGLATAATRGSTAVGVATPKAKSNCDGDAGEAIKTLENVRRDLLNIHGIERQLS